MHGQQEEAVSYPRENEEESMGEHGKHFSFSLPCNNLVDFILFVIFYTQVLVSHTVWMTSCTCMQD